MKFSDINRENWVDLKPYMDTCLIPITGLEGCVAPWEATLALEQLRDALELIEIPYKGRVITYPAIHFTEGESVQVQANHICAKLKETGFTYVIVMTIKENIAAWQLSDSDLLLYVNPDELQRNMQELKQSISQDVQRLWKRG